MKKIIRSQFYQLGVDKAIFLIFIIWVVIFFIMTVMAAGEYTYSKEIVTGGFAFAENFGSPKTFPYIITVLIMSKDFSDKTINYDLLNGKSRAQVFFGRFLTALIICIPADLILSWGVLPLVYTVKNGWGENLLMKGAAVRTLMNSLLTFRICCEATFITMVLKRKGIAYFLSLPTGFFEMNVSETVIFHSDDNLICKKLLPYLNIFSLTMQDNIFQMDRYYMNDSTGTTISRFNDYPDDPAIIILFAAGIGLTALIAGYRIFKRKDLE